MIVNEAVFRINNVPPTSDALKIAKEKAIMQSKVASRFAFGFFSLLVIDVLLLVMRMSLPFDGLYLGLFCIAFLLLICFCGSLIWVVDRTDERRRMEDIIDPDDCYKALELSKQYPEIEAYRIAVARQRQLVKGDLQEMIRYKKEQNEFSRSAQIANASKTALKELHKIC